MSATVWDLTLEDFLARTASAEPTPGGGSVAMVNAALGLGLVIMALEVTAKGTDTDKTLDGLLTRARALLARMKPAPGEDIAVFDALMAGYRLPRASEEEKAARRNAIAGATLHATQTPLDAAALCLEGLNLALEAAALAKATILSDVAAGALLLESGGQAVLLNVDINLPGVKDEKAAEAFRSGREHTGAALKERLNEVRAALRARE